MYYFSMRIFVIYGIVHVHVHVHVYRCKLLWASQQTLIYERMACVPTQLTQNLFITC